MAATPTTTILGDGFVYRLTGECVPLANLATLRLAAKLKRSSSTCCADGSPRSSLSLDDDEDSGTDSAGSSIIMTHPFEYDYGHDDEDDVTCADPCSPRRHSKPLPPIPHEKLVHRRSRSTSLDRTSSRMSKRHSRTLLEYALAPACVAALDDILLASPTDAFAELCWSEAVGVREQPPTLPPIDTNSQVVWRLQDEADERTLNGSPVKVVSHEEKPPRPESRPARESERELVYDPHADIEDKLRWDDDFAMPFLPPGQIVKRRHVHPLQFFPFDPQFSCQDPNASVHFAPTPRPDAPRPQRGRTFSMKRIKGRFGKS